MSPSIVGLLVGLILGVAFIDYGGFLAVLVVCAFGAIGFAVGGHLGGQFDLRELAQRGTNRE